MKASSFIGSIENIRHWWRRGGLVLVTLLTAQTMVAAGGVAAAVRWFPLGYPPEGENKDAVVCSLAVDPHHPDMIWIGLAGEGNRHQGIFKTEHPGNTWDRVYAGEHYDNWSLAFAPSQSGVVYAASDKHEIIRSVDEGANWMKIPAFDQTEAIAVDPTDSLVVYAVRGFGWGGMKTITAGGGSWENFGANTSMRCIAIAPQDSSVIFVGTTRYEEKDKPGIIRSTDGGRTWTKTFEGEDVTTLAVDPLNSRNIYAGTTDHGLFRSRDGGTTWQNASQGITLPSIGAIAVDPVNPRVVYAGTRGDGVFRSEDGGDTWQPMNTGLTQMRVSALAINPRDSRRIYAGTSAGVFRWGRAEAPAVKSALASPAPIYADTGGIAGGVPGGVQPEVAATSRPADAGGMTAADNERQFEVFRQAEARERRGKVIGVILLVLAVVGLLLLFIFRKGGQQSSAEIAGSELIKCTRPATIAGFVFTGIYTMAGLFLFTKDHTVYSRITGTWVLVDALLFLTGSLLAQQGRTTPARVIWIIAGIAGFPLGMVMVGFANHMNMKLKAAEKKAGTLPPVPGPPGAIADAGGAGQSATNRGEEDALKSACKKEIMRFLTTARTRQHEQQTGAWWSRNDLLLVVTKAGLDKGRSVDVFFKTANAAVDELAQEKSIIGTDSGYRAA